ncbi:MAG: DUF2244 domain-containing protein [Rhodothalassiaceae bacterium]
MTSAALSDQTLWFDAELRPHRSLSARGRRRLIAGVALVCLIAGARAWAVGAWPVMLFFLLDALLIWGAFKLNTIAARARERVRLSRQALDVHHIPAFGAERHARFEPYFTRVDLRHPGEHRSELRICERGRHTVIGSFLPSEERAEIAGALDDALFRLKTNQPPG